MERTLYEAAKALNVPWFGNTENDLGKKIIEQLSEDKFCDVKYKTEVRKVIPIISRAIKNVVPLKNRPFVLDLSNWGNELSANTKVAREVYLVVKFAKMLDTKINSMPKNETYIEIAGESACKERDMFGEVTRDVGVFAMVLVKDGTWEVLVFESKLSQPSEIIPYATRLEAFVYCLHKIRGFTPAGQFFKIHLQDNNVHMQYKNDDTVTWTV